VEFNRIKYLDDRFMMSTRGLPKMTKNFLIGRLSYNMINIVTEFLDIRQCTQEYGVKVIVFRDMNYDRGSKPQLNSYLIDMLVRNGFYVVDPNYSRGFLNERLMQEKRYGIYRDKALEVKHIVYIKRQHMYDSVTETPYIRKQGSSNTMAVCMRVQMHDRIDLKDFGILPSSFPNRGQVICVFPPLREYKIQDMVKRAQMCLEHRYLYMNTGVLWPNKDMYATQCGYNQRIILPRKARSFTESYFRYRGKTDMYVSGGFGCIDEDYASTILTRQIAMQKDKMRLVAEMSQNWASPSFFWLGIWRQRNYTLMDIIELVEKWDTVLAMQLKDGSFEYNPRRQYFPWRKNYTREEALKPRFDMDEIEVVELSEDSEVECPGLQEIIGCSWYDPD